MSAKDTETILPPEPWASLRRSFSFPQFSAAVGCCRRSTAEGRRLLVQTTVVTTIRGFILQASYRVVTGPDGARTPVVHLYGRLEDGGTFLRARRPAAAALLYPRGRRRARARARRAACPSRPTDARSTARRSARSRSTAPPTCRPLRDRLHAAGIETFEADVRFAVRYLIERGIKGGCEIEGRRGPGDGHHAGCSTIRSCGRPT